MMMPKSLLELTTQHLYKNFDHYDRNKLKPMLAPLVTIREMTLANFRQERHESCVIGTRCVDRYLAAWSTLFKSKHCLKLDQNDLILCPRSNLCTNTLFQEVVRNLPINAPNLQEIDMTDIGAKLSLSLLEREIDAIVKLTRLTRLDTCGIFMSMSGLLKVMEYCKMLEYINAEISNLEVEVPGTLIRDDFMDYWIGGTGLHDGRISITLRKNKNEENDLRGVRHLKRYVKIYINSLSIAKLGLLKNLYSHITHLTATRVRLCDLPKWSTYGLQGEFEAIRLSPHCPNVHFDVATARAFQNFVIEIGQNLVELYIRDMPFGQITLDRLSMWCPNLVKLYMIDANLSGSNKPLEHLRCLRVFNCVSRKRREDTPLGSILMAPLIERFEVTTDYIHSSCNIGDRDALIGRIARREILKKLEYFRVNIECSEMRPDFDHEDVFYSQIIEILKHCRVTE